MSERPRILVVDDEPELLNVIGEFLEDQPYQTELCSSGEEALKRLDQGCYNVVVTDLRMAPTDGLEVLRQAKQKNPYCEIIMVTAYASLDSSVEALRGKVFDYLEKPINLPQLERTLHNAVRKSELAIEHAGLIERLNRQNEQLERQVQEATRELQERTIKDYLTGLSNYRFFVNALTTEISRAIRYGHPMCLVMLDLDYFKLYNDALGHLAGNEVLKKVAQILLASVRENDMVARYGGEEFSLILPETTKDEATPIVRRIQKAIRERPFPYPSPSGEKTVLTISAGIAACPEDAEDFDSLVRRADEALYRAKSSGRDQMVLASGSPTLEMKS